MANKTLGTRQKLNFRIEPSQKRAQKQVLGAGKLPGLNQATKSPTLGAPGVSAKTKPGKSSL